MALGLCAFSLSHFLTFSLSHSFAQADTSASAKDPLAARQQIVRDRLIQLEDRMFRLTEKLSQTEPEQARRLEKALHQSGELLIRHHMDQAIQALERDELTEAVEHQAAAEKALQQILVMLTESADEALDRQREMDRLNELRREVDKLLENQLDLRGKSNPSEGLSQRLSEAAAKIQALIERQQEQADKTAEAREAPQSDRVDELAEAQAKLHEDTDTLVNELNPPGTPEHPDPLAHAAAGAREDLQNAADHMRAAENDLGQGEMQQAEPQQARALESLRQALEKLQQAAEANQPMDAEAASGRQRELEAEAGKIADAMQGMESGEDQAGEPQEGDSQPSDSGQPSESGQPGESGQPSESQPGDENERQDAPPPGPTQPGSQNLRRAQQHMEKAGDKLESQQAEDATGEQDKAIQELEQARKELQDSIDQLRREQQEEMLAGLEQRFRTMLIAQQAVNTATDRLDARKDEWTRSDSLELAGLSEKQNNLRGEAAVALDILHEEGTTVVFPQLVAQVRDDMADSARRLGEKQTGEVTRGIQVQIVETLEELIEAIEQRQKNGPPPSPSPGGGQGGGEPEAAPLLPGSAELKLLRSCQLRVNRQTQSLGEAIGRAADDAGDRAQRLSERQEQLSEMARKMNERR